MAKLVPPPLSAPGVYVQEGPSGNHAIAAVPTAVAAFVGRTPRGPVDSPMRISSFGDFIQLYGGLDFDTPLTYAVQDFFHNGGTDAWICRVWAPGDSEEPAAAKGGVPPAARPGAGIAVFGTAPQAGTAPQPGAPVGFQAASPGAWGNKLRLTITLASTPGGEHARPRAVPPQLLALGLGLDDLFDITIEEVEQRSDAVQPEVFRNCTVHADAFFHRVDRVLRGQSRLVRVVGDPDGDAFPALQAGMPQEVHQQAATGGLDSASLRAGDYTGDPQAGLYLLQQADLFNTLVVPPDQFGADVDPAVLRAGLEYCCQHRAVMVIDAPTRWQEQIQAQGTLPTGFDREWNQLGLNTHPFGQFGAIYLPYVKRPDPLHPKVVRSFPPCGIVAGIYARNDAQFGVARAPAGLHATMEGVQGLEVDVDDDTQAQLDQRGINVLRTFPGYGTVVWGARTLRGADELDDDYKYLPVRRLALFLEESLRRGLQWVVFEPNDEQTWRSVRAAVDSFMSEQFRMGCFAGTTARDAWFVQVDATTTTPYDIARGIMNLVVGFAPVKPAEFVVLYLELLTGQAPG